MRLSAHVQMSNQRIDNPPNQFDLGNFLIWEQPTIKGNYVTFSSLYTFSQKIFMLRKRDYL